MNQRGLLTLGNAHPGGARPPDRASPIARLRAGDAVPLLGITVIMAAASLLVLPGAEAPIIDDWTYAWSVKELLRSGQLRFLDWSAHYPIGQILWAMPFAHTLGFSFFALRVSTLVLAWLGLLALFLTLRAGGVSRSLGAVTTLVLLFNPIFFLLAHSFMTDVPFVSVIILAMLTYGLWAQGRSDGYLALGGTLSVVAFMIRQLGALTALVPVAYLLLRRWQGDRRPRGREVVLSLLPPILIVGIWAAIYTTVGTTSVYSHRLLMIQETLLSPSWWLSGQGFSTYLDGAGHAITHTGFMLAPLALCLLPGRSAQALALAGAIVAASAAASAWHRGTMRPPRVLDGVLTPGELGLSRFLVEGRAPHPEDLPDPVITMLSLIGLMSATVLLATLFDTRRERRRDPIAVLSLVHVALHFAAIEVLGLYHDRYYLTLLPGLLYLIVTSLDKRYAGGVVAAGAVLVMAAVSITGTIDHFRFARALTEAHEWLLSRGIPPHEIDGGYTLNGWWLFAHPENLPPGRDPKLHVTFVTSKEPLPYVIASSPLPSCEIIRVLPFRSMWAASDRLYVLKRP